MAIQKHMLPILEYDEDPGAILMPNREEGYRFPEKAVFAFLGDEIEQFAVRNQCEMIGTFVTNTKTYPVYQTDYQGETVCFCQAPLGSAAAVQFLDFLISCGVRKVISAAGSPPSQSARARPGAIAASSIFTTGTSPRAKSVPVIFSISIAVILLFAASERRNGGFIH